MKVLYITTLYLEKSNGISKKILAQVEALRNNKLDTILCHYARKGNTRYWAINEKPLEKLGNKPQIVLRKITNTYYNPILSYIKENNISFIYLRYNHNASPIFNSFLKKIKQLGVRIILEIPTYPYDGEYNTCNLRYKLHARIERHYRKSLHKYIDRIVTFSNDNEIFDIPTLRISNAINLANIPLRADKPQHEYIRFTGVANLNFWHGYDRLIEGMREYYAKAPAIKVLFDIVGDGVIKDELEKLSKRYNLTPYIKFYGLLSGSELDDIFKDTDVCVGCLACHRKDIKEVKSLKNIEYAARGIPFIYSENNDDFDKQSYIIKATPDETPINIHKVIENLSTIEHTPKEIRNTILHLSWDTQMQNIADYIKSF